MGLGDAFVQGRRVLVDLTGVNCRAYACRGRCGGDYKTFAKIAQSRLKLLTETDKMVTRLIIVELNGV